MHFQRVSAIGVAWIGTSLNYQQGWKTTAHASGEAYFDRLINEKYDGERGSSQAMFVYKMELRDAVCERFQSTEILWHAERILGECSSI